VKIGGGNSRLRSAFFARMKGISTRIANGKTGAVQTIFLPSHPFS